MALVFGFSRFIPVRELVQIFQKILSSVNKYTNSETNFITTVKKTQTQPISNLCFVVFRALDLVTKLIKLY